jgi:hypothetical protein
MHELPAVLPVRCLNGRWQVLFDSTERWQECESEADARLMAKCKILRFEALEVLRTGDKFAAQLEQLADTMQTYRIGFGSRFFRRRAEEARRRLA